ncbi:hypothetical protein E4U41_004501 [Claviceps citrina]|nr:hypothetical protein E4U41_004501 [Claviceps citrina]
MAAAVSARRTLSPPPGTAEADVEDSNISSPLSEFEEGDANEDDIPHMQIDDQNDDADNSGVSGDEAANDHGNINDRSDSESALSEAGSEDNSQANDTEAETERLYDTPKNQRQRDVVFDQYSQGQVFEHTPSKLRSAPRIAGDKHHVCDDVSVSDEDGSSADADDSPPKPVASIDTSVDGEGKRDSLERKRKRSPAAGQSEIEEPLRKRLTPVGAAEPDLIADTPTNDECTTSANLPSCAQSAGEDTDAPAVTQSRAADGELPDNGHTVPKKLTRNGSKRKTGSGNVAPSDTPRQDISGDLTDMADDEEPEQPHEDTEVDADEHDAMAKSVEEERKNAAFRDWSQIEEMFGIFRDRLYKDRLQRLEEEELSLVADVPTHPEFLNMKQCLDNRLERKIQEVNAECAFRLEAHERRAVAIRAQVWSQFFQAVRERREAALESLNRQWYEIQTARRSAHSLPDFGLLFPKDQGRRVRNAIAYNTEVSTLAGLAKYEGFPAGPDLKGASSSEAEADFSAIEKVRRGRQKPIVSARDDYPTPTFTRLGPAGEQFIKDTPWANPHHSSHKLHQQTSNAVTHGSRPKATGAIPAVAHPSAAAKPTLDSQSPMAMSTGTIARASESLDRSRLSRPNPSPSAQQMKTA